jgi:hypothetical protein
MWITGYGGTPQGGATPVWITAVGGPPPASIGATQAQIVGYGPTPPSGPTPAWVVAYGGNIAPPGATPIWIGEYGGATATVAATWNPADQQELSFSNGNLTATNIYYGSGRSTTAHGTGKYHVEFTFTVDTAEFFGFANAAWDISNDNNYPGIDINGVGLKVVTLQIFVNSSPINIFTGYTMNIGDIIAMEIDFDAKLLWVRNITAGWPAWNGPGPADPAMGTGGISLAAMTGPGPWFVAVYLDTTNIDTLTANFGASPFALTPSSGFSAW